MGYLNTILFFFSCIYIGYILFLSWKQAKVRDEIRKTNEMLERIVNYLEKK